MSDEEDTSTLSRSQQEDPEVQHWRSEEDPSRVKEKREVLLRVWRSRNKGTKYEQIVLPEEYRSIGVQDGTCFTISRTLGKTEDSPTYPETILLA